MANVGSYIQHNMLLRQTAQAKFIKTPIAVLMPKLSSDYRILYIYTVLIAISYASIKCLKCTDFTYVSQ